MKRTFFFSFFLFFSLFLILVLNTNCAYATSDESVDVKLYVRILDVDPRTNLANVKMLLTVPNYPYNWTQIEVIMEGGGSLRVTCENVGFDRRVDKWVYEGESNQTSWYLEGTGETYPFNSYNLRFEVQHIHLISNNFSIISENAQARFSGPNYLYLKNGWTVERVSIPKAQITTKEVIFSLQKTPNALVSDIIYSLVPIIACYYLLGATLILNPKDDLSGRLRIYLSLFIFSSTFLFTLQASLPFHSSITFPELLLSNLTVSTAIFTIFSLIGNKMQYSWDLRGKIGFYSKSDSLGLIIALSVFVIFYAVTLFGKLNNVTAVVFTYIVIPSYPFALLVNTPKRKITKNKLKWTLFLIFALFPLELILFVRLISLFG